MDEPTLETKILQIVPIEPDDFFEENEMTGHIDVLFRLLRPDGRPSATAEVRVFLVEKDRNISFKDLSAAAIRQAATQLALIAQRAEHTDKSDRAAESHPEWFR